MYVHSFCLLTLQLMYCLKFVSFLQALLKKTLIYQNKVITQTWVIICWSFSETPSCVATKCQMSRFQEVSNCYYSTQQIYVLIQTKPLFGYET